MYVIMYVCMYVYMCVCIYTCNIYIYTERYICICIYTPLLLELVRDWAANVAERNPTPAEITLRIKGSSHEDSDSAIQPCIHRPKRSQPKFTL